MATLTEKQRLLKVLDGQAVDRPPVICPGGMMSVAVTEVMDRCGYGWPQAHTEASAMTGLAIAMHELAGLENLAVPFCMTVEAEAFGAPIDLGGRDTQPRVTREPFTTCREVVERPCPKINEAPRTAVVLAALRQLTAAYPDTPAIGNLVGPVSLLGSLVEPGRLLREMFRTPEPVQAALERVLEFLLDFGAAQVRAGAEVIAIADPTATGEILGPRLFSGFARPYLARLVSRLHEAGVRVIIHICGKVQTILPSLAALGAEAISVDEVVSLRELRAAVSPAAVMGNLSALTLEQGPVAAIGKWVARVGLPTADIIAPACAVVPATPLAHLQALAAATRAEAGKAPLVVNS